MTLPDLTHGSRWWKMDFHAHTPHSSDWEKLTPAVTIDENAPEDWLRRYMEAEVDAVAITDHNGGGYIDPLKDAYATLAADPCAPDWFRPLALFPGVEITVNGDLHLLAIFDPSENSERITRILAESGVECDQGDASGCTSQSMEAVCRVIVKNGGVAIPAHADERHGLLEAKPVLEAEPDQASCKVGSREVISVIESGLVLAFELSDIGRPLPTPARDLCRGWPCVIGTDWHNWKDNPDREPGRRFTWVKMGTPDLEGLRLALQEGFPGSIRRFDGVERHPITPPALHIDGIHVSQARYAGRNPDEPLYVPFSPWLTTLIGGRGSGKSTIVELLRLALDRGGELSGEVREDFERFARKGNRSEDDGALTGDTRTTVDYVKHGQVYRLRYVFGQPGFTVDEVAADGTTTPADGSARNFQVRIFSQKQIYRLASDTPGLLSLMDETPEVDRPGWEILWNKAVADYRSTRARARAERATTAEIPTLRHQQQALSKQLEVFESGENKSVLQDYQRLQSQRRHFEIREEQSTEAETGVRTLLEELAPPDPPLTAFGGEDPASVTGRELMQAAVRDHQRLVDAVRAAADAYAESGRRWKAELEASQWSSRSKEVAASYAVLAGEIVASGMEGPGGYTRLIREKQMIESRLATAVRAEEKAETIEVEAADRLVAVLDLRKELTRRRRAFLADLPESDHVKIEIRGFGTAPVSAEAEFREAINKPGPVFANDIRDEDDTRGLLVRVYDPADLPDGDERDTAVLGRIDTERDACLAAAESRDDGELGLPFKKHLRSLDAEQLDRLRTWWPEDEIHVTYRDARGRFRPIQRASAGEKSAAVLAFILSHGEEPLILDQPEDDLDNHLIFHLIVKTLSRIKRRRQIIVVTHNPNIVVNGDSELINAMSLSDGQIIRSPEGSGCLQDPGVRREVCNIMEGGREAFESRYRRVVKHIGAETGTS